MAELTNVVELGFAEECHDPEDFDSSNFPSKVGGKPVWLDPVSLPSPQDLLCRECQKPCVLLLQVYAPHTDDPATFHRTLYVFMCTDPECSKVGSVRSFRVFRCQLPKQNPYYDNDDKENDKDVSSSGHKSQASSTPYPSLCAVCGSPGPSGCGHCMGVHYCSRRHQVFHWRNGHKATCSSSNKDKLKSGSEREAQFAMTTNNSLLLPELQIITETEPDSDEANSEKSDSERLKEYEEFVSSEVYKANSAKNVDLSNQLSKLKVGKEEPETDKTFRSFKKRVAKDPEQVIRFQPGGVPLLITQSNPPVDIPHCETCGQQRQFELQVMPQLLYYLKVDALSSNGSNKSTIDWGTLLLYTCAGNCNVLPGYREEFLWKQDLL